MRKNIRILIMLLLVFSMFNVAIIQNNSIRVRATIENQKPIMEPNYIVSIPILIDDDQDFIDLGFPGDGSSGNPYRIEYLSFALNYGISVFNTTMNFIIQHCYFSTLYEAIELLEIAPFSCTIYNNTITQIGSFSNVIILSYSDGTVIEDNNISDNYDGIHISYSFDCEIRLNEFSDITLCGLTIYECRDTIIANNTFVNDGIDVRNNVETDFTSHTVENNTVNGKQLGWFGGHTDEIISSDIYGQIYLVDCDNVTLSGLNLNNTCISVYLAFCWECEIIDCELSNNNVNGMQITDSGRINIVNCNSSSNVRRGFNVIDSLDTSISNSYAKFNGLSGVRYINSHYSNITHSTISENGNYGAWIESNNVFLADNTFEDNGDSGIYLGPSTLCEIIDNQIIENNYGVECSALCTSATIHGNYFIDNSANTDDDGVNNVWFDIYNNKGNWYSDWVTSPYNIPGSAGSVDSYPLNDPAVSEYNLTLTLSLAIALSLLLVMTVSIRRKK